MSLYNGKYKELEEEIVKEAEKLGIELEAYFSCYLAFSGKEKKFGFRIKASFEEDCSYENYNFSLDCPNYTDVNKEFVCKLEAMLNLLIFLRDNYTRKIEKIAEIDDVLRPLLG